MTFNACIKKHFDEAFGPYGFKKIKSKYPYWGRMVGDEILQIITYKNEWSMKPYKDFSIWGGVATVYRKKIDLDIAPRDQIWMQESRTIYELINNTSFENYDSDNSFEENNEVDMEKSINNAISIARKGLLEELKQTNDIKSCVNFFNKYNSPMLSILCFDELNNIKEDNEGILFFLNYNYEEYCDFKKIQYQNSVNRLIERYSLERSKDEDVDFKRICLDMEEVMKRSFEIFSRIKNNEKLYSKLENIADRFKENNMRYFLEKGIIEK